MRKRMIGLIVCFILIFTGCGRAAVDSTATDSGTYPTIEELQQANSLTEILKSHSSVSLGQLDWTNGDVCHKIYYRNSDDTDAVVAVWNDFEAYGTDGFLLSMENGKICDCLSAGSETDFGVSSFCMVPETQGNSTVTADTDGNYVLTENITMDEEMANEYGLSKGDILNFDCLFDKSTLLMKEGSYSVTSAETGKTERYADCKIMYDQEVVLPQKTGELLDGKQNTLTLSLSDGTIRTFSVPAETEAEVLLPDGQSLYDDSACTHQIESKGIVLTEDTQLFCK